jgi:peptidoglycan hydrolase-like protein with peptidoglycan-binding domain
LPHHPGRLTRYASAATIALSFAAASPALAASPGSGGASLGGSGSSSSSTSKTVSKSSAQVSDSSGHVYPGDSQHMGDRVLRQGMSGHDVRVLQDFLTRAGYATPIVGVFGPTTKRNVIAFQTAHSLAPTGVVTYTVNVALRSAAGAPQSSQSASTVQSSVPGSKAHLNADGTATAPADAPAAVKAVIAAGNNIAFKPYVYGGGHGSFNDSGYDCSGSVSYALHGGGLISSPEDSGQLESYGGAGAGQWITLWSNAGHVYMYVAGLRFDTSSNGPNGSRWTTATRSNAGFVERHPTGY